MMKIVYGLQVHRSALGLALVLLFSLKAQEPTPAAPSTPLISPVGFVVETQESEDRESFAQCIRGGQTLDAEEGFAVYPGDIIVTNDKSEAALAMLDSSAVTLRASTRIKIDDYLYPAEVKATHVSLQQGAAFFSINPRPADAHFFIGTAKSQVEVKGTKFQVYTVQDPNTGAFNTTVAVTQGIVSLQPETTNPAVTDVVDGTSAQVYLNIGNPNTKLQTTKLTGPALQALKKGAVETVQFSTGTNGKITISVKILHADGGDSVSSKVVEVNGLIQSGTMVIKDPSNKTVETYRDSTNGWSFQRSFDSDKIKLSIKGGLVPGSQTRTGTGSFTDGQKRKFTGTTTLTVDSQGRFITFKGTSKDGTTVFYTCQPGDEKAIFVAQGQSSGTFEETQYTADGTRTHITGTVTIDPTTGAVLSITSSSSTVTPPSFTPPPPVRAPTTPTSGFLPPPLVNPTPLSGG